MELIPIYSRSCQIRKHPSLNLIETVVEKEEAIDVASPAYVVIQVPDALSAHSGHTRSPIGHSGDIYHKVGWIVIVNYFDERIGWHLN